MTVLNQTYRLSLLAAKESEILTQKRSKILPLSSHKNQPQNPWIHLWFYSPNRRNYPRYILSLRSGCSGRKRAIFLFSPPFEDKLRLKTLNIQFLTKKQVFFWEVYPLKCKLLIINWHNMLHRQIEADKKQLILISDDSLRLYQNLCRLIFAYITACIRIEVIHYFVYSCLSPG